MSTDNRVYAIGRMREDGQYEWLTAEGEWDLFARHRAVGTQDDLSGLLPSDDMWGWEGVTIWLDEDRHIIMAAGSLN